MLSIPGYSVAGMVDCDPELHGTTMHCTMADCCMPPGIEHDYMAAWHGWWFNLAAPHGTWPTGGMAAWPTGHVATLEGHAQRGGACREEVRRSAINQYSIYFGSLQSQ
jgi:hypothetical protein